MTTDLESILRGGAAAPASEPAETPPTEAPAAEPNPAPEPGESGAEPEGQPGVPVGAIRQAEREKANRRYTETVADFERKLAEQNDAWERRFGELMQKLAPPPQKRAEPDIFDDPRGFVHREIAPLAQGQQAMREQFSQMLAVEKFGADKVDAAYKAFADEAGKNPALQYEYERIMASAHPYGELIAWHEKNAVIREIGADPAAYREKLKAELLAEIQSSGQPSPQGNSPAAPAVMPTNLAGARNAGARTGPAWSGPRPLADIFARR